MVFLVGKDHYLLVLVNTYVNESPTDYQPMQERVQVCSAGYKTDGTHQIRKGPRVQRRAKVERSGCFGIFQWDSPDGVLHSNAEQGSLAMDLRTLATMLYDALEYSIAAHSSP